MAEGEQKAAREKFWRKANLHYSKPHYRLEKSAVIINRLARGRDCTLLDVGCGPAALRYLLTPNIEYHGIDIAIQKPAPDLRQIDLIESPIEFGGQQFDLVVAQGFFEYIEDAQEQKLAEIQAILGPGGRFLVSYVNFGHRKPDIPAPYSNVQPMGAFRRSLERYFTLERSFATSHNWRHNEPGRRFLRASQLHLNVSIPVISSVLAVEYFFICSGRGSGARRRRFLAVAPR